MYEKVPEASPLAGKCYSPKYQVLRPKGLNYEARRAEIQGLQGQERGWNSWRGCSMQWAVMPNVA